jgi:tRNA(Ile)-lysidine synthase
MKNPRASAVEQAIAAAPRLRREAPVLVGVSGGRDSVVLLHALVAAGFRQVIVVHLDHALRPNSVEDAWLAAELAHQHGCSFEADRCDVRALAQARKLSLEAAAREARYEFFSRIARLHWCPRVLLAHHADDQVETLLLNLLRGAARSGLAAMRPVRVREMHGARIELHRPLLGVWREEIDAYAREHALKFHDDPTNTDRRFARNRIRHDVLPVLESAFDRQVRAALWRTADILGAEEEWIESQRPPVQAELRVAELRALPAALQRRLIHAWLKARGIGDVSHEDVVAVQVLVEQTKRAKVNLSMGRHARRRAGRIFVE